MTEPRIILLCSGPIALPALQELAFFKQLVAVVIPRENEDMIGNVKMVLQGVDIPLILVSKDNYVQQISDAIEQQKADAGLIITFSYIIPAGIFTKTINGFYNVHPGPLPSYRGADPVFRQIMNREKNIAVTLHKLDQGVDTGPVVMQEWIPLLPADTYGMVNAKLSHVSARLVRSLMRLLQLELSVPSRSQNESLARYFKKQGPGEIVIDWLNMEASAIIALINACNPWNKGAVTKLNHKIIRLLEAEIIHNDLAPDEPGIIHSINGQGIFVSTADKKTLCIKIVYTDEGYLPASRGREINILPGHRFQPV